MEISALVLTFLIVGGLAALTAGGEFLIRGSSALAAAAGISPLVIGLTIVAFGTSAPELVVSLSSALKGNADIAVANVVGSNNFNVLFILGICALLAPLRASSQLVRLDVPLMVLASLLFLFLGMNGHISRAEGIGLFALLVAYTTLLVTKSRAETKAIKKEFTQEFGNGRSKNLKAVTKNLFLVLIGLGLLVLGGNWLVDGAVDLAKRFGISDAIIGLTIVAIGTSLPEVATSILATMKGERDIAIGNIVGSNIYNILAITGLTSAIATNGLSISEDLMQMDIPIMIGTSICCLPIFAKMKIARWEGFLFFSSYVLYTIYLILKASEHSFLSSYKQGLILFALPAVATSILVITYQASKKRPWK